MTRTEPAIGLAVTFAARSSRHAPAHSAASTTPSTAGAVAAQAEKIVGRTSTSAVAVALPKGSTPIDFAFHVHTEVGLKCQGAKINGRIAPLHRELKSGDTVEILTGPGAKPSRDWLSHVRTARARQKIKQWVNHEEETVSRTLGKEILTREVRRRRLDPPDDARLAKAAVSLSLADGPGLE